MSTLPLDDAGKPIDPPPAQDPRREQDQHPDQREERKREERGNRGPGEVPGFGQGA